MLWCSELVFTSIGQALTYCRLINIESITLQRSIFTNSFLLVSTYLYLLAFIPNATHILVVAYVCFGAISFTSIGQALTYCRLINIASITLQRSIFTNSFLLASTYLYLLPFIPNATHILVVAYVCFGAMSWSLLRQGRFSHNTSRLHFKEPFFK